MARHIFSVIALWDEEAKVFYSESDIDGLTIETATIEEFEAVLLELGPDMILANHILKPENANLSLADLIPTIVLQKPQTLARA